MTQKSTALPEYEEPPVSEVALSVEFTTLPGWHGPLAGLYWSQIKAEYPNTEVHQALPTQVETFGQMNLQAPTISFAFGADPSRYWFKTEPPTYLIQVQNNRFVINWRKLHSADEYPRYDPQLRPRFRREWGGFKKFVAENKLGELNVRQCEVSYTNDLPKGKEWSDFTEVPSLLSYWSGQGSSGFLPPPETLTVAGSFLMPQEKGRLHFAVQHALKPPEMLEILQMRLTARCKPLSSEDEAVMACMDLGREWVVRGFTDMTTPKAHDVWKRRLR